MKSKFTEKQLNQNVSMEMFKEYQQVTGVDFFQSNPQIFGEPALFIGYLLHKYPKYSEELINLSNTIKSVEVFNKESTKRFLLRIANLKGLCQLFGVDKSGTFLIYEDFSEFVNFTNATKMRVNEVLLEAKELFV